MKTITDMPCKKHVFVCANDRGPEKSCCMNVKGYETFKALKEFVMQNGLAKDIWVTKTGCLGFCNDTGCTIVVYPDKVWFLQTTKEDLKKVKEFIAKGLAY
ncbi:MAG: (2Fe-2S) ferredoxin domain-containing protein [Nanoarchaeota archaeon]